MSKRCLVYVGDIHFRSVRSRRRVDDPVVAMGLKIRHVVRRALELNAEGIVLGGDLGHDHDWRTSLVGAVKRAFEEWEERRRAHNAQDWIEGKRSPLPPILTIVGNHDVPSYNYDHMDDTGIQACEDHGFLKILWEPTQVGPFEIWPFHAGKPETAALVEGRWRPPENEFGLELDIEGMSAELVREYNPKNLQVALVHAPVGPVKTPSQHDYRDVFVPFFDVAAFADIHDGFPIHRTLTGCTLINPGSVCRWNINDRDRTPQFAVIWDDGEVQYEAIPCAPPDEVFDLTGLSEEEQREEQAASTRGYLAAVSAAALKRDEVGSGEFVRKVGAEAGFSKEAIDTLVDAMPDP